MRRPEIVLGQVIGGRQGNALGINPFADAERLPPNRQMGVTGLLVQRIEEAPRLRPMLFHIVREGGGVLNP